MPHLLFRGVPAPGLRSLAPELVQEPPSSVIAE